LAVPYMQRLFRVAGLVSYRQRINERYPDREPVTVTVAAGRIAREDSATFFSFALAACLVRLIQFTAPFRQLRHTGPHHAADAICARR